MDLLIEFVHVNALAKQEYRLRITTVPGNCILVCLRHLVVIEQDIELACRIFGTSANTPLTMKGPRNQNRLSHSIILPIAASVLPNSLSARLFEIIVPLLSPNRIGYVNTLKKSLLAKKPPDLTCLLSYETMPAPLNRKGLIETARSTPGNSSSIANPEIDQQGTHKTRRQASQVNEERRLVSREVAHRDQDVVMRNSKYVIAVRWNHISNQAWTKEKYYITPRQKIRFLLTKLLHALPMDLDQVAFYIDQVFWFTKPSQKSQCHHGQLSLRIVSGNDFQKPMRTSSVSCRVFLP